MSPAPLPDLDAMMDVTRRLEAARAADPVLAGAEPVELIRHVAGRRAIVAGRLGGEDVIFRLDLTGEARRTQAEWDEMLRLWPHMAEGRFRIARPIHAAPAHGLLVCERVAGTPMLRRLRKTGQGNGADLLRPVADWFRQSTAMSEARRLADPGGWLRRATEAAGRQPFAALRRHEGPLLAEMERLAEVMQGASWRTAICHGDLHPNNLIVKRDRITAIDLGGSSRMPVYKDMARFLLHMARRDVVPSGRVAYGVDRAGLEAFAAAFGLDATERGLFLPFLLGFEALIRVESDVLPQSRIDRAERLYADLLPDMARAGTDDAVL